MSISRSPVITGENKGAFNAFAFSMSPDVAISKSDYTIARYYNPNAGRDPAMNSTVRRSMRGIINSTNVRLKNSNNSYLMYSEGMMCNSIEYTSTTANQALSIDTEMFNSTLSSDSACGFSLAVPVGNKSVPMLMQSDSLAYTSVYKILEASTDVFIGLVDCGYTRAICFINNSLQGPLRYVFPVGSISFDKNSKIEYINIIGTSESFTSIIYRVNGSSYYAMQKKIESYSSSKIFTNDYYEDNIMSLCFNIDSIPSKSYVNLYENSVSEVVSLLGMNEDILKATGSSARIPKVGYSVLMRSSMPLPNMIATTNENDNLMYPCTVIPTPYAKNTCTVMTPYTPVAVYTDTNYKRVFQSMNVRPCGIADYGADVIAYIPGRNSSGDYAVLPSRISDYTGIQYNVNDIKLSQYNATVGQTSVCVDDNIYHKSKFSLVKASNTPMLPENGKISIYSGYVFVSNDNSCSIYTVTELGFIYITSIPSRLISNVVSISGSLVFYADDGIWSYTRDSGLIKLAFDDQADGDTAVIRALDGYPFLAIRSSDGFGAFTAYGNALFSPSDAVEFICTLTVLYCHEIGTDLSIGFVETQIVDIFEFFSTNTMTNEGLLAIDSNGGIRSFSRSTGAKDISIEFRCTQFFSNDTSGFLADFMLVIVKTSEVVENAEFSLTVDGETNLVEKDLTIGLNRVIIPMTTQLTESIITLSFPKECSLVGCKLSGNYIKHMEE
jgi:hypothetical protein